MTTAEKKRPKKRAKQLQSIGELAKEAIENGSSATTANGSKPAKEKAERPRKERPRQKEFPGMEKPRIKEIEDAAYDYRDKRDARMACSVEEKEAANKLVEVLKKHKVKHYDLDDDLEAAIVPTEFKVKVRKKPKEKDPAAVAVKPE